MREEIIGDAHVFLGDCREVLPALNPVDLILTDAPYKVSSGGAGQRERLGPGGNRRTVMKNGFGGWLSEYGNTGDIVTCDIEWSDWMPMAYEILKDDRQAYFMCNGKNIKNAQVAAEAAGFDLHTICVWDKRSALPNRWYQNVTEFTLFMKKGKAFTINNPSAKNLVSIFQVDDSDHSTEKPVSLMAMYIENSTKRGDVVLDCFMGSGTTGVAALQTGRKFIGVELEERWFDVACRRLESALKQPSLF